MTKKGTILNLQDLQPAEIKFKLKDFPGKEFTLCRWSLRVRAWATAEYGAERLQKIFKEQNIIDIAAIAWYMLKEKEDFGNSYENFIDKVSGVQDELAVVMALLGTIGIGEPEIKKIKKALDTEEKAKAGEADPNEQSPESTTGAESLTP